MHGSRELMQMWNDIWEVLRTRPDESLEILKTKQDKSKVVSDMALKFRARLLQTIMNGKASWTYYMHCLVHHLPHQIEILPVDITDSSAVAIEWSNQATKFEYK
jgi:hypothetical protein